MTRVPTIPLSWARYRLAIVWFPLSGVIFLLLVLLTFSDAFGNDEQKAWGWALPNFLPTLALMGSVFASTAMESKDKRDAVVRVFFFRLAFWLSLFYFLILFIVLLAPVFNELLQNGVASPARRLSAMERSNIFLGPLQSFVVGVIGVLFILKEKGDVAGG